MNKTEINIIMTSFNVRCTSVGTNTRAKVFSTTIRTPCGRNWDYSQEFQLVAIHLPD